MKKHRLSGKQVRAFLRWVYTSEEYWPTHMRSGPYSKLRNLLRDQTLRERLPEATGGAAGVERIEMRIGHITQVWVGGQLVEVRED